jgi:ABC-2 type transport system permease protein
MQPELAAPACGGNKASPLADFFRVVSVVLEAEIRKLLHDPAEMLSRITQPVVWLIIFAPVFSQLRQIPTGGIRYADFIAPGILSQGVLFLSVVYGINLLYDRDTGLLQKYLVSPASRGALVLGKSLASGIRNLPQTVIIYIVLGIIGGQVRWTPAAMLTVAGLVVTGSALFCSISLVLACLVKNRERFMAINQAMTVPLFFASNALYPVAMMPEWLREFTRVNPLSYLVDGLRASMLRPAHSVYGLGWDLGVQLGGLAVMVLVATRLYPRVEY